MNPAGDSLYRIHQLQAQQRGQSALPYDDFCARIRSRNDSDLGALLMPSPNAAPPLAWTNQPKFPLGQLCITPNAASAIPPDEVLSALARHAAGDWGTLDAHDWQENENALLNGGRLFSAYQSTTGEKFWIITDSGGAATTILLPDDY